MNELAAIGPGRPCEAFKMTAHTASDGPALLRLDDEGDRRTRDLGESHESTSTRDGGSSSAASDRSGGILEAEAKRAHTAWGQRLGYLLALVEQEELADCVDGVLAERNAFTVALAPWQEMEGTPRDTRWQVAINVDVEPDV